MTRTIAALALVTLSVSIGAPATAATCASIDVPPDPRMAMQAYAADFEQNFSNVRVKAVMWSTLIGGLVGYPLCDGEVVCTLTTATIFGMLGDRVVTDVLKPGSERYTAMEAVLSETRNRLACNIEQVNRYNVHLADVSANHEDQIRKLTAAKSRGSKVKKELKVQKRLLKQDLALAEKTFHHLDTSAIELKNEIKKAKAAGFDAQARDMGQQLDLMLSSIDETHLGKQELDRLYALPI